jgi:Zn-finger nucleic acid-binding protein
VLNASDNEIWLDAGMLKKLIRMVDNYEPPDPDGEAFRGREAAAFEAEQMARIQRKLK